MESLNSIFDLTAGSPYGLSICGDSSVESALKAARENNSSFLVVFDHKGKFLGLLNERDLYLEHSSGKADPAEVLVKDVISRKVACDKSNTRGRRSSDRNLSFISDQVLSLSERLDVNNFVEITEDTLGRFSDIFEVEMLTGYLCGRDGRRELILRKGCSSSSCAECECQIVEGGQNKEWAICRRVCGFGESESSSIRLVVPLELSVFCECGNSADFDKIKLFFCVCCFNADDRETDEFRLHGTILIREYLRLYFKKVRLKQKYMKVLRDSNVDSLTGVHTRSSLERLMNRELQRSIRYKSNISILILDVDNFKNINDRYGHQEGDLVLKFLGQTMHRDVRECDIVGRYGGDEFIIVMPETKVENARRFFERFRVMVSSETIGEVGSVTVSCGITGRGKDSEDSVDEIIGRADKALYEAKHRGRNAVVVRYVDEIE